MIARLLQRSVSIYIVTIMLVTLGLFSLWRLPVALLPTLERPQIEIVLEEGGSSREELLHEVVLPLERRLATLEGVVEMAAEVDDGRARLVLETEWQTDVDQVRIDVQRRLSDIASRELDRLDVQISAGDARPILQIAVTGGAHAHARTLFAEKVLVPELGRLDGAGTIEVVGGAHRRAVVRPQPAQMAAHGVTADAIRDRLWEVGRTSPLGSLREGGLERALVLRRPIENLRQLRNLEVRHDSETRLGDVAEIGLEEVPAGGIYRWNGEDGILVEVYRAPGANAVVLARQGRAAIATMADRARHVRLHLARDSSREVVAALSELAKAGGIGLLLGTLILWWTLGSWRPTVALAVVVPVSIVAAFSAFYFFGVALDIVSLAGLALAAGMLVDNSIVVLEAITSARERDEPSPVESGTRQIAMALVASFLTTAVVFLPLVYSQGLARAFFGVQAFAIVTTLTISLALSLTLTPILARRLAGERSSSGNHVETATSHGRRPGSSPFSRLLELALGRPALVLALVVVVSALATVVARQLPKELVPAGQTSRLAVDFDLPSGLDLEEADRRSRDLEEKVVSALAELAGSSVELDRMLVHRASDEAETRFARGSYLEVDVPVGVGSREALHAVERAVHLAPGLRARVSEVRSAVSAAVDQAGRGVELELSANTPARLDLLVDRVTEHLRAAAANPEDGKSARGGSPGIGVTRLDGRGRAVGGLSGLEPAWSLRWDPIRLAALDVRGRTLVPQLRAWLGKEAAGRSEIEGIESEIVLDSRADLDLPTLPIGVPGIDGSARMVPLGALASIEKGWREPPLDRRNGRPAARLRVEAETARVLPLLDALELDADQRVELGARARELRRSFDQLGMALALALVLVFLTVAAIYESLVMPLVVMATVPLAAVGAVFALAVGGQSWNVMSLLGLILLTGIVVNNAIVLVHRAEQWRAEGLAGPTAVRRAARERYRPILVTTLTTLLGMLPLALLGGEGLELRRALAVSVSGGLVTSWIATLLLVPVLYSLVHRGGERTTREPAPPGSMR